MPSTLAWLDYAEKDRRAALEIIDRFKDRETRDELGLGSIRDAFANMLFPGTSTIQTRARYFLFIPWIYTKLEDKRTASNKFYSQARRQEMALITALLSSDDRSGIIGKDAREELKRLPGNIYWQGLESWRIRLFLGSQDNYYRSRDAWCAKLKRQPQPQDKPEESAPLSSWHSRLPQPPDGFPEKVTFRLETAEASYLIGRIVAAAPDSLLAFLVERGLPCKMGEFAWQHPQFSEFSESIKERLAHARNFSETLFGISLLYNFMLATELKSSGQIKKYEGELKEWSGVMEARKDSLQKWDLARFWLLAFEGNPRIHPKSRAFVEESVRLIRSLSSPRKLISDLPAQTLIRKRESALKGKAARLGNPRRLELWRGESGASQIDYRWSIVQQIVADIVDGRANA